MIDAPKLDDTSKPIFRTFKLPTSDAEMNAIGIGLVLLSELEPRAQLRVAEYWIAKARHEWDTRTPDTKTNDDVRQWLNESSS